jgi:NCS1 family nucleobase:cation symporter-1
MVVDYWYLRRAQLDVEELYRPDPGGAYWYSGGYNWRALAAVAIGVIPVLPGFLHAATTEGGVIADPDFLDDLYRYGVFVAFALSAVAYLVLMRAQSTATSPAAATAD